MGLLFSGCNKCNETNEILAAFVSINTDNSTNYTKITGLGSIKTYTGAAATTDVPAEADGFSYDCLSVVSSNYKVGTGIDLPEIPNCQKIIFNTMTFGTGAPTFGAPTTLDYACV